MMNQTKAELTTTIIKFLREIGFEVATAEVDQPTILPGILVDRGTILVDDAKLLYPGDLLHEAGHLAVIPSTQRQATAADVGNDAANEMMAIAWSYAASVYLGLDPAVVFHADGYRGGSASLIENFTQGRYFGVPMLQWLGLTAEPAQAQQLGVPPYPHMIRWLAA